MTRTTTMKEARVHQMLARFLRYRQPRSGTNNNQSAVLLNYCCSRESDTLQRKNEGVQWYSENVRFHILHGSYSVFGYPTNRICDRCPVSIDSDKRRSTI
ncbi:hypothetical protein TNCV_245791 [Trichonephila clavipes]|nr:hypothetical protein TNCV_245791 [Trichonephila clavipes]